MLSAKVSADLTGNSEVGIDLGNHHWKDWAFYAFLSQSPY